MIRLRDSHIGRLDSQGSGHGPPNTDTQTGTGTITGTSALDTAPDHGPGVMSSDLGTCDAARCGARAYIAAVSPQSGKMLTLCAHHYGKAEKSLAEARWIIEDWRQELEVTR